MGLNLTKNVSSDLVGLSNTPVNVLNVGVGWDNSSQGKKGIMGRIAKAKGVDLDLACLVYDEHGSGVRICGFDTLSLYGGALLHTGDNRTGKGDGIDETIIADLTRVQSNIRTLVFTLNAFKKGVSFTSIAGADCFIMDQSSGQPEELGVFSVPIDDRTKSTVFMAKATRAAAGDPWKLTVVNEMTDVNGAQDLLTAGKQFASR